MLALRGRRAWPPRVAAVGAGGVGPRHCAGLPADGVMQGGGPNHPPPVDRRIAAVRQRVQRLPEGSASRILGPLDAGHGLPERPWHPALKPPAGLGGPAQSAAQVICPICLGHMPNVLARGAVLAWVHPCTSLAIVAQAVGVKRRWPEIAGGPSRRPSRVAPPEA